MDWEYVPMEDAETRGAPMLCGVPSFGMVGPVAVRFLVEHLKMRPVGGFQSDALPPTTVAWEGVVTGPIQVFALPHGQAGKVLVLNSDVAIEPEAMMAVARAICDWASKAGVQMLIGLEGYGDEAEAAKDVRVASNHAGEAVARKLAATPVHATFTGFNAALLTRANRAKVPAVGLFAPVESEEEDAAAAARLLKLVSPLVHGVNLAPSDLVKKAEQVQTTLRAHKAQQAQQARRLQDQVDRGYV
ncbi:MAG: PAC2 family protein [Halobacteriales archaeon]|nr:PAC2 family protein [Halobacteriales archaeon]